MKRYRKVSSEAFQKWDARLIEHANAVLKQRTMAYGDLDNQLANFDAIYQTIAASIPSATPELVWVILWQKGLQTLSKIMLGEDVPGEEIEDRFSDAINYLRLGYAMKMRDRVEQGQGQEKLKTENVEPVVVPSNFQNNLGPRLKQW